MGAARAGMRMGLGQAEKSLLTAPNRAPGGWPPGARAVAARGSTGLALVIILFVLVASLLLTFGRHSHVHNSDSLLPAIMSVEHLTWYYWGQDRFGNLLPFLASPIKNVSLNFHVQVFLRNVCAFVSVFLVFGLAGHRGHVYQRFFVTVLVMLSAAGPFMDRFFGQELCQPIACAVFALGLAVLAPLAPRWWLALPQWLAATALFAAAFFVDRSLIAIILPFTAILLGVGAGRGGTLGRPAGALAVTAAAAAAWVHASWFEPHTPLVLNPHWDRLNAAVVQMLGQIDLTVLAALLLGAASLAAAARSREAAAAAALGPGEPGEPPALVVPARELALITALGISTYVFANLAWVEWNDNATRYYSVAELCLVVLSSSWAVGMFLAGGRPAVFDGPFFRPFGNLLLPVLALAAMISYAGYPAELVFEAEPRDNPYAFGRDIPRILAVVPTDRPMVALGGFWNTVPLVYERLRLHHMPESYAIANHWEPMRPTIAALFASGRPFSLVCLGLPPPDCAASAQNWIGPDTPPLAYTVPAQDTLESGPFAVLAVGRKAAPP